MQQFIYFIQAGTGPVKIGYTTDVIKRFHTLQSYNYERLNILRIIDGDKKGEAAIHRQFRADRVRGEWFWPTKDLLEFIDSLPADTAKNFNEVRRNGCECGNGRVQHMKYLDGSFKGFCHTCLMVKDGRMSQLLENRYVSSKPESPCKICNATNGYLRRGRCSACAAYFKRTGMERTEELIHRPKNCINCGKYQKQLVRKLCHSCYYYWKTYGVTKPTKNGTSSASD